MTDTPTPGPQGTPGAFAWDANMPAEHVDLLKAKGMYDDPVKGANMLVGSYFHANKALSGGDVLVLPAAGDAEYDKKLDGVLAKTRGVAKFEEYEVKGPEHVKPEVVDFAKKLAFEWGVPKARVQKGIDMLGQFGADIGAAADLAAKQANDAAIAELRTKKGEAVYNAEIAAGQNVVKALKASGAISQATLEAVEKNIGSLALIELVCAVGAGMKEGKILGHGNVQTPTDPTQMTAEQAKSEIERLNKDPDFQKAYTTAMDPGHAAAVARMAALFTASVPKRA